MLAVLGVLLLVVFDEEVDTAKTNKISLRTCICLKFMRIILNVETTKYKSLALPETPVCGVMKTLTCAALRSLTCTAADVNN